MTTHRSAPARAAHGWAWWLLGGWVLALVTWSGRVLLWLLFWPLGLWRSLLKGRRDAERRMRRGARH